MKKNKRRKHKPSKKKVKKNPPRTKSKKTQKKSLVSSVSFGWKIFVGFSVVLTVIGAFYSFLPKLEVSSYSSLNPSDPFSTPFILRNESVLPIYNVKFSCFIKGVEVKEMNNFTGNFATSFANPPIPVILAGEQTTTFCMYPIKFPKPITLADIEVMTEYKPKLLPFVKQSSFRFVTSKNRKGELIWIPKAVSEQ